MEKPVLLFERCQRFPSFSSETSQHMIQQGRSERIGLASGEKGEPEKQKVFEILARDDLPVSVVDLGSFPSDGDEDASAAISHAVSSGNLERGILVGTNTLGMSMLANKFWGVRAVAARSPFEAALARRQFDANVLCLKHSASQLEQIISIWLLTPFEGDDGDGPSRHARRVGKIAAIEQSLTQPAPPPPHFARANSPTPQP